MTIRFNCLLFCILLSGCVSLVKISYPPEAVIHPTFDQPYTIWRRERVQVEWTPSLHAESFDRVIFLAVPHRGSRLAAGLVGSVVNRIIEHSKSPAQAMKGLATQYPGILDPYFAKENARGGPTSLSWLAPNPLLDSLAALPIEVPFHSIIGNRGINEGANSTDGIVDYKSSHLAGAESEKIVPAGHNLIANPATVAEIKRILEENISGRDRHRP
jgi:hypothetical protein